MDGEVLLGLNEAPSFNAVLRALKREEGSLYNCVASIVEDALFVDQVAALYPSLPLFPNLRCGLWYVRPPTHATCYFKSTDGHNGNWSFSTIRLNLNVAEATAAAGGCVIVDATKRGKRFPDAMSKTLPIWAAVMNRAVYRLRQGANPEEQPVSAIGAADSAQAGQTVAAVGAAGGARADRVGEEPWDDDVHLPPWVSDNEANSIRRLLDGWVDQLLEVGADLSRMTATLRKPLRCLWVSQDSRIWVDSVADTASLSFTPLILVGASATTARQRRCLTLPAGAPGEDRLSVSYSYFPGAADDEESWACGLTPELMWRHLHALLAAGPAGVEPLVRQLLDEQRQQEGLGGAASPGSGIPGPGQPLAPTLMTEGTAGTTAVEAAAAAVRQAAAAVSAKRAITGLSLGSLGPGGSQADPVLQQPTEAGLHCLLPQGCLPAQAAAVQQLAPGIFLLGSTGLALSSAAAADTPAVWQHVNAVLHLGTLPLAGMQQEPHPAVANQQQHGQQQTGGSQQPAPQQRGRALLEQQRQQQSNGSMASTGQCHLASCRYCWLPVRSSKQERHSLQQQLPAALRFAHAHLADGGRLLLCCDSGLDASVCVAVSCLLAFYRLNEQPSSASGGGLSPLWVGITGSMPPPASSDTNSLHHAPEGPALLPPVVGSAGFSKLAVRQHLAAVSAHYPAARPTRASLRQVFNFFLSQSVTGSTIAPDSD